MNTEAIYTKAANSKQSEKYVFAHEFFVAAIKEYEAGREPIFWIGTRTIGLINTFEFPKVGLFSEKLSPLQRLLEELYGVAGRMDLAGQGGASSKSDRELLREYCHLVERYAQLISQQ